MEFYNAKERLPQKDGFYICESKGHVYELQYCKGHWNCHEDGNGRLVNDFEIFDVERWTEFPDKKQESLEKRTIYIKSVNNTWTETFHSEDKEYVYSCLARDLLAHYVHKAPYIKRITDRNNYTGTRTIIVTYDNGTRSEYIVKD